MLPYELSAWYFLVQFVHSREEQWSQGSLWYPVVRYPFDTNNKLFSGIALDWFEKRIGPYLPSPDQLKVKLYCEEI